MTTRTLAGPNLNHSYSKKAQVLSEGASGTHIRAVLFDRDGTLIHNVPYNTDPEMVHPIPGTREALETLRHRGILIGVVTNQSGVGRGLLSWDEMRAVNRRVEELLGPFDHWGVCPHSPEAGCPCRKPRPGLIQDACAALDVPAEATAVIGDIGADMGAARSAGTRAVLVPTACTLADEIASAPLSAHSIHEALSHLGLVDAARSRNPPTAPHTLTAKDKE